MEEHNDASQQQKEINDNNDVIHGDDCIHMVPCQGIQHVLVQRYLQCKEPCYAALWGYGNTILEVQYE